MSDTTKIEWADSTFNPWIGCTKVSREAQGGGGCDYCYAENETPVRVLRGRGHETFGAGAARQRTSADYWRQPLRWNAQAAEFEAQHGRRRRVFCASLADVFDNAVDPAWRADLFALIKRTPSLDWLLLTKRIGNAEKMIDESLNIEAVTSLYDSLPDDHVAYAQWPWKHVWLGATIVNQAEADRDIPKLLATPAAVRFVSIEPMLGPVNLDHIGRYTNGSMNMDALRGAVTNGILAMSARECSSMVTTTFRNPRIDWVIAGGESGPHARAAHPDWFRSLRDQCAGAGVPFLFKQWGEWRPPAEDEAFDTSMGRGTVHCFENDGTCQGGAVMLRVGKRAAGGLLDGMEHLAFPKPSGNTPEPNVRVRHAEVVLA